MIGKNGIWAYNNNKIFNEYYHEDVVYNTVKLILNNNK